MELHAIYVYTHFAKIYFPKHMFQKRRDYFRRYDIFLT